VFVEGAGQDLVPAVADSRVVGDAAKAVVVLDRIAVIGSGPFGKNLVGEFANAAEGVVEGRRRTAVEEGHEDGDGGRRIIVICRTGPNGPWQHRNHADVRRSP
jgi:hypothetical protein